MPRPSKPWYRKAADAWYVTHQGRKIRLARGRENRQAAELAWHMLKARGGKAGDDEPQDFPVVALVNAFLDEKKPQVDAETYRWYKRFLGPFSETCEHTPASRIYPEDVNRWLAGKPDWNDTTRNAAVGAIKVCFRWGAGMRIVRANRLAEMKRPTAKRRSSIPDPPDMAKVLDCIRLPQFRDFAECLYRTGCRPIELATLTADRVRTEAGIWLVRDKIRAATGEEFREVFPPPPALVIGERLAADYPTGPIFRNRNGKGWTRNAWGKQIRNAREHAGVGGEAVAYALRHLFATDGLARGIPIATVAALLGHRNAATTARVYSHLKDRHDHLKEASRTVRGGSADEG